MSRWREIEVERGGGAVQVFQRQRLCPVPHTKPGIDKPKTALKFAVSIMRPTHREGTITSCLRRDVRQNSEFHQGRPVETIGFQNLIIERGHKPRDGQWLIQNYIAGVITQRAELGPPVGHVFTGNQALPW